MRSHAETGWRSRLPPALIMGSCCRGTQISGGSLWRVSPKNPGGSDADYDHGMAFDDERGTYDGRIGSIGGLPDTVAEDGDRRCGGLVVLGGKDPAAESANSQG